MAIFTRRGLRLGPAVVLTEPAEVGDDYPAVGGLRGLYIPGSYGGRDLSKLNNVASVVGTVAAAPSEFGPSGSITSYQPSYLVPSIDLFNNTSPTNFAIFARIKCSTFSQSGPNNSATYGLRIDGYTALIGSATPAVSCIEFRINPSGTLQLLHQGAFLDFQSNSAITTGAYFTVGVICRNSVATFYVNGQPDGSKAVGSYNVAPYSLFASFAGSANNGTYDKFTGDVSWCAVWADDVPSAGEAFGLYAEPFAMLRPDVRRQYYVAASAVAPGTTRQPVIWFGN